MRLKFFIFSCLIFVFVQPAFSLEKDSPSSQSISVLKEASMGFSEVAEAATPAVVNLQVTYRPKTHVDSSYNDFFYHFFGTTPQQLEPSGSFGSGFFISSDGYILTNNHLVQDAADIKVYLVDGSEYDAQVVGSDPNTEVAVIKVEGDHFPYLNLANSDDVRVGQWAIAIGSPFGFQSSLTVGVVSATNRSTSNAVNWENYIQTDAAINPGNSGGPLLNINGEVMGINTAILTKSGGYLGIGFAIPSNLAKHISDQLIQNGYIQRGYLGITAQSITPDMAKALNLDSSNGVVVVEVNPNSPAEKAGLKQNDVITKINGKALTSKTNISHEISLLKPGSIVVLTIDRHGKEKEIKVSVGSNPSDQAGKSATQYSQGSLGIEVEDLTLQMARQLGYEGMEGVVVTKVAPNSQLAMASVRPGTLIMAVNRQKVQNTQEFYQTLSKTENNKRVLLLVRYGKMSRYITVAIK